MPASSKHSPIPVHIFLAGTGLIGTALLAQIAARSRQLARDRGLAIRVVGIANSRHQLVRRVGLDLAAWAPALAASKTPMALPDFVARMTEMTAPNRIFVDCTASDDIARVYPQVLAAGIHVVTASKRANAGRLSLYRQIRAAARRSGAAFRYETNVGAGLPIIGPLQDMLATGDRVRRIDGVLSGTLSYLFNAFTGSARFSAVVRSAKAQGYTEPDPRDDLSGLDVARKLLILARETGLDLTLDDVQVESLVPASCTGAGSPEAFLTALERGDGAFEKRRRTAESAGQRLRYLASLADGRAQVHLAAIGSDHPFWALAGSENVVAIHSDRYAERPLVIKGPGAGAEVTAAGVFADILRCVEGVR